ncbi:hypothetical protein MICA_179 [Micavibrio aeruginosavorus ARL-13]|uniref:Uncharacterized protein n=1 Tax=Micavibrio aeruginosavorus (strain ARL-13) TaxID=856793 RepID=G2KP17_MICAA|nr:hypothetical protein MICA_179 [Micavibrio aeruginosavorus ARL-13]
MERVAGDKKGPVNALLKFLAKIQGWRVLRFLQALGCVFFEIDI